MRDAPSPESRDPSKSATSRPAHTSSDSAKALDQLWAAEYRDPAETVFRLTGTVAGAGLLYAYTGWVLAIVWIAVFLGTHLVHYIAVGRMIQSPRPLFVHLAGGLYLLTLVAYIWIPVILAAQQDPILAFSGMLTVAAAMVYHIRRADVILWLVLGQAFVLGAALFAIMAMLWSEFHGALPKSAALLVTAFAILFLVQALLSVRRDRIEMARAAERLAQRRKVSAIGRLAGGIAHDFNNVLTVVLGNLDLYREFEDSAEKDAAVAEAKAAARRAELVVQQLLIYARKAPTRLTRLDCNPLVQATLDTLMPNIPDGMRTETRWSDKELYVLADEMQLSMAVVNLVRNALEAMGQTGTLRLETALRPIRTPREMIDGSLLCPGDYVEISVIDDGHGIPADALSRVTEPFFSTNSPGQGSGLGLSMVLGFVRKAGGGLHIESRKGHTAVKLILPVSPQEEECGVKSDHAARAEAKPPKARA